MRPRHRARQSALAATFSIGAGTVYLCPGQRARSAVAADHRSVHPNVPGVPWWGAVLIAVTATAIGFAFDASSGNKELGLVFAAGYVVGCILAVLAVRQSSVFTAVIQPPLILFVTVPGAYFLFHGSTFTGLKDVLINCGYPLIERFPLMFFTSAAVLLIGMARWYYGMSTRRPATPKSTAKDAKDTTGIGRMAAVTSKMSQILTREPAEDELDTTDAPRRKHSIDRPSRAAKPAAARGGRPAKRAKPSRSRHARPPDTEIIEPVVERPRRPRPARQVDPPRCRRPSRGGGRAHPRHVNRARHRRRLTAGPPMSGPNGVAAWRGSNPKAPTATARTTRYRGCATAAPTTAMTVFSTGAGPAADTRLSPRPGSTTFSSLV